MDKNSFQDQNSTHSDAGNSKVDIVIPIYNSLHHVRACVGSVINSSQRTTVPHHVYLCDDGSDSYVVEEIERLVEESGLKNFSLLRSNENQGYLRNCNGGMDAGNSPFVLLLNSDTVVHPGYLERIVEVFEENPTVGIINPVSTWANWTRIPFPNGHTILDLPELVSAFTDQEHSSPSAQEQEEPLSPGVFDIWNASGFCFGIRRELFSEIGLFDLKYDPGYYEEADFCMKALRLGARVVVDTKLYIFHHGWGTFGESNRNAHMTANREVFMNQWKNEYSAYEAEWKENNPVAPLSEWLEQKGEEAHQTEQAYSDSFARTIIDKMKEDPELAASFAAKPSAPSLSLLKEGNSSSVTAKDESSRVLYILPSMHLYGGVISVIQVVNQLIRRGINANIVTYGEIEPNIFRSMPLYFRPYVFSSMEEMVANFPPADLVVATHWLTAQPAVLVRELTGVPLVYFVQDYEPDFYPIDDTKNRPAAERTYELITNRICKSAWLERKLSQFPGHTKRITLGLNTDIFYPKKQRRARQLIAMARPSSPRRNYEMLKRVYSTLHKIDPTIQLALYGIGHNVDDFDCPVRDYGKLNKMEQVAGALNDSQVLLDPSTFQGFGRPGLEAMACGTATVLTRAGGITEYAKHEVNSLLVDPTDEDEIVERIVRLFSDDTLRETLVGEGEKTSREYSYEVEGERTAQYFTELLRERPVTTVQPREKTEASFKQSAINS